MLNFWFGVHLASGAVCLLIFFLISVKIRMLPHTGEKMLKRALKMNVNFVRFGRWAPPCRLSHVGLSLVGGAQNEEHLRENYRKQGKIEELCLGWESGYTPAPPPSSELAPILASQLTNQRFQRCLLFPFFFFFLVVIVVVVVVVCSFSILNLH